MLKLLLASFPGILIVAFACSGNGGSSPAPTGTPEAVTAASGCSSAEATELKQQAEPLFNRFNDSNVTAGRTDRLVISPLIEQMQEVSRDFAALDVPPCAQPATDLMVGYMEKTVELYSAFRDGAPDATVAGLLKGVLDAETEPEAAWALIFDKAEEE